MALYSAKQLAIERSKGLVLSDYANEHFYDPNPALQSWSRDQFENWLATKAWADDIKNQHRQMFQGFIAFNPDGSFSYD